MKINRVNLAAEMARQMLRCGDLAEKAGVSRVVVTKARSGQPCMYESARRMAKALNVPTAYLIEEEED